MVTLIYAFKGRPFIPVEFADATYRSGHPLIRATYQQRRKFPIGTDRKSATIGAETTRCGLGSLSRRTLPGRSDVSDRPDGDEQRRCYRESGERLSGVGVPCKVDIIAGVHPAP
jgi:hypothetical protein